jgi:hypothetical protein
MMPRRPPWLEDTDAISRVQLFVGLQGLVTYGSPLDKFAALWPKIVCLNQQSAVFPENCEWLNLYDATDPVSGNLDAFTAPQPHRDAGGRIAINPENACCRASPIFLLSHLRYLTPRRRNTHSVPSELFDAIIDGTALQAAVERSEVDAVHRRLRGIGALVQVLIVTALLTVAAAILVGLLCNLVGLKDHACPKAANLLQPACQSLLTTHALFVLGVTWVAVVAVGLVRLILSALARRHQKAASKARQPERAQPA